MINLKEIKEIAANLEEEGNYSENLEKLAVLYSILDHHVDNNPVVQEYQDILPSYQFYCKVKTKYELHEIGEEAVKVAIKTLCVEIAEFLKILYGNTDTPMERDEIKRMLRSLTFH